MLLVVLAVVCTVAAGLRGSRPATPRADGLTIYPGGTVAAERRAPVATRPTPRRYEQPADQGDQVRVVPVTGIELL